MELPIILGENDTRAVRILCIPEINYFLSKLGQPEIDENNIDDATIHNLGVDVSKGYEVVVTQQISPILKERCYGVMITGWERQDAEWIDSGHATEAGKIAVRNDPSYIREILQLGGR